MFKTIAQLAAESGLSAARVMKLLDGVTPEVTLGRTKGYHPDALRASLINKLGPELDYLNVRDRAADVLAGFTQEA